MSNDNDLIRRGDALALPYRLSPSLDASDGYYVSVDAIRALAASFPADPVTNAGCRQQVKVKPLVWAQVDEGSFVAHTAFGDYVVELHDQWGMWTPREDDFTLEAHSWHMTEDAAKAAAQADYEDRILSALEWETTVSPEVQALVYSAEKLLEAYSAIFGAGNPWGDELRAALAVWKEGK